MDRYLYEVRPLRPIHYGGKSLRVATSMLLTADEVKYFLSFGPVYRKFPNEMKPIKVTGDNLIQLHQPAYHGVNNETEVEQRVDISKKSIEEESSVQKTLQTAVSINKAEETKGPDIIPDNHAVDTEKSIECQPQSYVSVSSENAVTEKDSENTVKTEDPITDISTESIDTSSEDIAENIVTEEISISEEKVKSDDHIAAEHTIVSSNENTNKIKSNNGFIAPKNNSNNGNKSNNKYNNNKHQH